MNNNYVTSDKIIITDAYDKIRDSVEVKSTSPVDTTPQKFLWEIYEDKAPALLKGESMLDIVFNLTASYYFFGKKFLATKKDALNLVDYGRWIASLIVTLLQVFVHSIVTYAVCYLFLLRNL